LNPTVRRIEIADFVLIAELHCGIAAEQLARIPHVVNLAEAALAAPFSGFGDYQAFPAVHEKAAVYCSRIVTYQPLPDGNKRTGYDVMREFLARNGIAFTHAAGGPLATAQTLEDLAAGALGERELIDWARSRTGG
jgi:death-on-curing protein